MTSYPQLGFGTSKLASFSSLLSRSEGIAILRAAIQNGISYIDTANVYGQGRAESWLGHCLRLERPKSLRIATKAGLATTIKASTAALIHPLLRIVLLSRRTKPTQGESRPPPNSEGGMISGRASNYRPEALSRALSKSLRRLGVDSVDDFFLHEPPLEVFDEDLRLFLKHLLACGLTARVGVCSNDPHVVALAHQFDPVSVIQTNIRVLDYQIPASERRISYVVNHVLSSPLQSEPDLGESPVLNRLKAALSDERFEVVLFGATKMAHLLEATSLVQR